jgi:hypothetical protein
MSETPVKVVVDLSKPKGQRESIIELTSAELTEREEMRIESEATQAAQDKAEKETAKKKLSGRNKLLDLGLTEAEVTALIG